MLVWTKFWYCIHKITTSHFNVWSCGSTGSPKFGTRFHHRDLTRVPLFLFCNAEHYNDFTQILILKILQWYLILYYTYNIINFIILHMEIFNSRDEIHWWHDGVYMGWGREIEPSKYSSPLKDVRFHAFRTP